MRRALAIAAIAILAVYGAMALISRLIRFGFTLAVLAGVVVLGLMLMTGRSSSGRSSPD